MSLDNVLAVAGAAHEHPTVLIVGLALSIAHVGLVIILYVALTMIFHGTEKVLPVLSAM